MDRLVRRAKIPVLYSEGYHPHARLSFAPPLPVGAEGWRELCVIELTRLAPAAEIARTLTRHLPPGMELVSVEFTTRGHRSPLADIEVAGYEMELVNSLQLPNLAPAVQKLLAASEWKVTRLTKSKVSEIDLRPGLLALELQADPLRLVMELSLGPETLVKPEEVAEALAGIADLSALHLGRTMRTYLR
jgi:radical SAM-linked protein